jgi:lipopolysaccharide heptosyltransferase I
LRILIVRLGALGDIVHAIPVAAALRRAYPDARIDWLVSASHREILELVPVISNLVLVNDRPGAAGGRSILATVKELRRARYDVALDLQGLIKSAGFALASGARRIIGFSKTHAREPVAAMLYTETYEPGSSGMRTPGEKTHVVRLNLGFLERLGIEAAEPEFPIEIPDSAVAREIADRAGGRYALLNPGAAWPNKRWPPDRFAAAARHLRDKHGLLSVALWGPGEEALAQAIVAGSAGAAHMSPKTSVHDLAALARGASIMVSGDTGPMHLAAAVGTPIVGIYGPTWPARNGPWRTGDLVVSRAEACECHHLRQCRRETMCLMEIGVDEMRAAIDRRLAVETPRG